MKNPKMYVLILLAIVFIAVLPRNAFPQGKPIELRLAHMFPVNAAFHQHIELWTKKIAEDSKGRLTIRIFPSNILIAAPEIYSGVAKGVADIGFAFRYKPENYTVGVTFPFLMGAPDTVTAGRVYDDVWKKFPKVMGEEWKDVKVLYFSPSVPQYFTTRKPLRRLEDFKGLQMRVPSRELGSLVKDLDSAPVFMSPADFVIALEKGTVDGVITFLNFIYEYKLAGKIKHVLMISLGVPTPVTGFMNKESFDRLPPDLQKLIDKSCEWGKEDALKCWSGEHDKYKKYCQTEGIELVYPAGEEKAKLVPIIERNRDKVGADLDAKGYPGTEIVRFIRERVEHYTK